MPDYHDRLNILSMETLEDKRLKNDLILVHKLVTNEIAIETANPLFCNLYSIRSIPRGIIISRSTKTFRNSFFTIRVLKII